MSFKVEPIVKADFAAMRQFVHSRDGHLTSPAVDVCWPVQADEQFDDEAAKRNNWSLQQQEDHFDLDPTVTMMKAVNTETGQIAALARWHYYADGFVQNDLEYAGSKDRTAESSYPSEGMNVALYRGLLENAFDSRPSWMGQGPFWVLTTIKTREPERRRGAGGLLVEWGVAKARADGCPAYLEAVVAAAHLYESKGFETVEITSIDLNKYGIPAEFEMKRMMLPK